MFTSTDGDEKLSKEELLRKKLLENYDKMSLPQRNHNGTTTVAFDILPNGILIDEHTQIISLNAWIKMVSSLQKGYTGHGCSLCTLAKVSAVQGAVTYLSKLQNRITFNVAITA